MPRKFRLIARLWILPEKKYKHVGFDEDEMEVNIENNVVTVKARKKIHGKGFESVASHHKKYPTA